MYIISFIRLSLLLQFQATFTTATLSQMNVNHHQQQLYKGNGGYISRMPSQLFPYLALIACLRWGRGRTGHSEGTENNLICFSKTTGWTSFLLYALLCVPLTTSSSSSAAATSSTYSAVDTSPASQSWFNSVTLSSWSPSIRGEYLIPPSNGSPLIRMLWW